MSNTLKKEETAYDVYNEGVVTPNNTVNVPSVGAVNVYTEGNPVTAKAQAYKDWTAKYGVDAEKQRQQMMGEVQKIYDRSIAGYGVTGELLRQNGLTNSGIAGIYQMQAEQNRRQGTASAEAIYADTERQNRVGYGQYLDSAQGSLASTASEYAADTGEQMKFDELVKIATTIYNVDEFTAREMARKALDLSASTAQRANQQIQGDLISSATNTALNMIGSGYNITSDLLMKQHSGLTREQADAILKDAYASLEMEYDPTTGTTGGNFTKIEDDFNALRTTIDKDGNPVLNDKISRDQALNGLASKGYSEEDIAAFKAELERRDGEARTAINNVINAASGDQDDFIQALMDLQTYDPNLYAIVAKDADDENTVIKNLFDYAKANMPEIINEVGKAKVMDQVAYFMEYEKDAEKKTIYDFIVDVAEGKWSDGATEAIDDQLKMIREKLTISEVRNVISKDENGNDYYKDEDYGNYDDGYQGVSISFNFMGKDMTVRADAYDFGSTPESWQKYADNASPNAKTGDTVTIWDEKGRHLMIRGKNKYGDDKWYWLDAEGDITQGDDSMNDEDWEKMIELMWGSSPTVYLRGAKVGGKSVYGD